MSENASVTYHNVPGASSEATTSGNAGSSYTSAPLENLGSQANGRSYEEFMSAKQDEHTSFLGIKNQNLSNFFWTGAWHRKMHPEVSGSRSWPLVHNVKL
jgi:hypothetical protein